MRIRIVGRLTRDKSGVWNAPVLFDFWATPLEEGVYDQQQAEPTPFDFGRSRWAFRGRVVEVRESRELLEDREALEELKLEIRHLVLKDERRLARVRREVRALENLERLPSAIREAIPEEIRLFVWQRDQGRCVGCGAKENLEFDHVIPVAEGGATTERNIQLLCLGCNRAKGKSI